MSSDHPGSSRSLFNYFPGSRSSSECAPSLSNEASLPESNLSSNEKECTPEPASSLEQGSDSRAILEPYQPRHAVFPPCKLGVQTRGFQVGWFDKWKWLDWDNKKECVYCHPCRMAVRLNFTLSKKAEPTISETGFRNWKDAVRCFKKHEASHSHRDATLKWPHYTKFQSVDSGSDPHQFLSPKEYYKRAYFGFADSLNGELNKRFCQKNYKLYMKAEQLLITTAITGEVMMENVKEVCSHFGDDLDEPRFKNQLSVLSDIVEGVSPSLRVIQEAILSFNTTSTLFSEVLKLLKLLFVLPASTASAERSFTSLRRHKTYLRSLMTAQRLNHVLLLHIHKDITETLDPHCIARVCVSQW